MAPSYGRATGSVSNPARSDPQQTADRTISKLNVQSILRGGQCGDDCIAGWHDDIRMAEVGIRKMGMNILKREASLCVNSQRSSPRTPC